MFTDQSSRPGCGRKRRRGKPSTAPTCVRPGRWSRPPAATGPSTASRSRRSPHPNRPRRSSTPGSPKVPTTSRSSTMTASSRLITGRSSRRLSGPRTAEEAGGRPHPGAGKAREVIAEGADGLVHLFVDRPVDDDLVRLVAEKHAFVIPTLTVLESVNGIGGGASLVDDPALAPWLSPADVERAEASLLARASGRGPGHPCARPSGGSRRPGCRSWRAPTPSIRARRTAPASTASWSCWWPRASRRPRPWRRRPPCRPRPSALPTAGASPRVAGRSRAG